MTASSEPVTKTASSPPSFAPRSTKETFHSHQTVGLLRILFVTPRYLPYLGGVENHVYQVAKRMARGGALVTVLTTDTSGQLPIREESDGVEILRVRAYPADRDYFFAPAIYSVIMRQSWDIVHVQSYHTLVAPLAMLAAWHVRIPYVVTFHGGGHSSQLRNAFRPAQRLLLRPLLSRASRLVALANFEINLYGKRLGIDTNKFVVIPNGSDLPQVVQSRSSPGKLIASVGRLERYKGHQRVIAALPKVLERIPDVHLWIAGTGPYEAELRRMARELGIAERVEIRAVPPAEREAMAAELSKAALVVLLSEYETHPIAVLEALSLGRPVLVADTSGLIELAERGLARAIPLQSTPEQVAAAIVEQLERPLIPAPASLPTWDDCAAGLLTLYQSVTRRHRCAS